MSRLICFFVFTFSGILFSADTDVTTPGQPFGIETKTEPAIDEAAEELAMAREIFVTSAAEFKAIVELSLDATLHLLGKDVLYNTSRMTEELVLDAFKWMGGAINFGHDHNYPVGARDDKRFQALHLMRATTYYVEWYLFFRLGALQLEHGIFEDDLSYFKTALAKALNQVFRPQTEEEIINFGAFPNFDTKSLIVNPTLNALKLMSKALEKRAGLSLKADAIAVKSRIMSLEAKLVDMARHVDELFLDLTSTFIGYQYAVNGEVPNRIAVDIHKRRCQQYIRLPFAKKNLYVNTAIQSKLADAVAFIQNLDATIYDEINSPDTLIDTKASEADPLNDLSKPVAQKKSKKKNKQRRRNNTKALSRVAPPTRIHEKDEPIAEEVPSSEEKPEEEKIERQSMNANPSTVDKPRQEKRTVSEKIKKETKTERKAKKKIARALERTSLSQSSMPALKRRHLESSPFLTKEVVEKFLDIFGNKEGDIHHKRDSLYQRQGWGISDDFSKTLKAAGWLVNQRQIGKGCIINEGHSSSTISFQMPWSDTHKPIYIKFHGDHQRGERMREIARHFIVKALEEFGCDESFWVDYYQKFFAN